MSTFQPEFVRHIYTLGDALTSYDKYNISNRLDIGKTKLTDLVYIEPFKEKSKAKGISNYLCIYDALRRAKKDLTGIRPHIPNKVFYGDILNGKKSLLILQFSQDRKTLVIDYFRSFYPDSWRTQFIDAHLKNNSFKF